MNWPKYFASCFRCAKICFAVPMILFLGATVVMQTRQVPVYESRATLRFPDPSPDATADSIRIKQNTVLEETRSGLVINQARTRMNRPAEDIAKNLVRITNSFDPDTTIIRLRASALDPVLAADFANAWNEAVRMKYGQNDQTRPTVPGACGESTLFSAVRIAPHFKARRRRRYRTVSSRRRNAEMRRKTMPPFGLWRRKPICCVAAPPRCAWASRMSRRLATGLAAPQR